MNMLIIDLSTLIVVSDLSFTGIPPERLRKEQAQLGRDDRQVIIPCSIS
jgi:hypothetical protein